MRISTFQIYRSGVDSMQRVQFELNRTGQQLSIGKKILVPSDDPSGSTQAAQHRTVIQATEQYQRNADLALPRLQQEEWAIAGITDSLQRVRELMIAANNDSQTNDTRGFMADEIRAIRDELFDVANTKDPNGEYLFGGTRSLAAPFEIDGAGQVSYVGATGAGAVREVAITPVRAIAVGDTGADLFMNILENDGRVSADVTRAAADPRGSLVIDRTELDDLNAFLTGTNASDEFEISFQLDAATNTVQYRVDNLTQGANVLGWTDYEPDTAISFAGRSLVLSGSPNMGDTVSSRPARHVTLFQTLGDIADALDTPVGGDSSRADLTNAINRGLADVDASLDHLNDKRATIGTRLQILDDQYDLNEERLLELRSTLSTIEDLDYAEAISEFKFQQVALEAAQQSYVQINRLSLFNFI